MRQEGTLAARFWARVQKSEECWLWKGSLGSGGYGQLFTHNDAHGHSRMEGAHRISWQLHYGAIPDGLFICHHCDVRACVRPEHLFLGTQKDNVRDMVDKGRNPSGDQHPHHLHPERVRRGASHGMVLHPEAVPRGERNANAKLTADDVRAIRARMSGGETHAVIARDFRVHPQYLHLIAKRKRWAHVE